LDFERDLDGVVVLHGYHDQTAFAALQLQKQKDEQQDLTDVAAVWCCLKNKKQEVSVELELHKCNLQVTSLFINRWNRYPIFIFLISVNIF